MRQTPAHVASPDAPANHPPTTRVPPPCPSAATITWERMTEAEQKRLRGAKLARSVSDLPPISGSEAHAQSLVARWPSELGSGHVQLADTQIESTEQTGKPTRKTTGRAPEARLGGSFAGAIHGDELAIWGGVADIDPSNKFSPRGLDSGAILNLRTGTWTEISSDGAPSPRSYARAILTAGELVVWGGNQHTAGSTAVTTRFDGGVYSRAARTWRPIPPIDADLQSPYDVYGGGVSAFLHGRTLILWTATRQTWLYDLDAGTWLGANTDAMPNGLRSYHRFATGRRHVAIAHVTNPGGIFDVTTRCWAAISVPAELAGYHSLDLAMVGDVVVLLRGTKNVEEGCGNPKPEGPACDPISSRVPMAGTWKLQLSPP